MSRYNVGMFDPFNRHPIMGKITQKCLPPDTLWEMENVLREYIDKYGEATFYEESLLDGFNATWNAKFNGVSWVYGQYSWSGNKEATRFQITDDGKCKIYHAVAGAAGAVISWVLIATFDADGETLNGSLTQHINALLRKAGATEQYQERINQYAPIGNRIYKTFNAYYDEMLDEDKFIADGWASRFVQFAASDAFYFMISDVSGVADDVIVWAEKVLIDATGETLNGILNQPVDDIIRTAGLTGKLQELISSTEYDESFNAYWDNPNWKFKTNGWASKRIRYDDKIEEYISSVSGVAYAVISWVLVKTTDATGVKIATGKSLTTEKVEGLNAPVADGEAIRSTVKITENALEDSIDKKHTQGTDTTLGTQTQDLDMGNYDIDNVRFIDAVQTVDQSTMPSIYGSQTASTLQDGSAGNTGSDEAFDNTWEAIKFTAGGNHNIRSFGVRLKVSVLLTNPTSVVYGYLYTDNAGVPGTKISGSAYICFGSITTSYAEYQFAVSSLLSSGTSYWLVLKRSAVPAGGIINIDRGTTGTALHSFSANGLAWTTENNKQAWHRIYGRTSYGVRGISTNSYGVRGSSTNSIGVRGISTNSIGVFGSSTNSYGVRGSSTNSIGVRGISTNFIGVYGSSTNSIGVYGSSTNSYGVYGISTNSIAGYFYTNPSSTNTIAEVIRVIRGTSGTAANGIGGSLNFYVEDTAGAHELISKICGVLTNATSGSETSAFTIWTRTGGAAIAERFRITGEGKVGILTPTPSDNADLTLGGDGRLCLKETTTPTADADYGKVYCKADNKLYFQDGAGVEHEIQFV